MKPDFDILIVGGGMVGACLAALIAGSRQLPELRIALLEARPPAAPPSNADVDLRVSAISRASERILTAIDAWPRIEAGHRSPYTDMIVWDATGKPGGAGSLHFSASETSEPDLGAIIENRRLQWAIYETPALRNRVTLLRAELSQLRFDDTQAVATLMDGRQIGAALVVGADGADSVSRRLAEIGTEGHDYEQRAFVTHVRTSEPHRHTAWQRFLPEGPLAFLPLADGRSSIVWTTTPEHAGRLIEAPVEQVSLELQQAIDEALGTVTVQGPRGQFPLRLIHTQSYCRERFVLVGDAAHAVHPLAGQGVNLGFLDCAALLETLESEYGRNGHFEALAELSVLRRYERWRKSENAIALGLIDGLNRLFSNPDSTLAWVRRSGLSAVDRSLWAKRLLMGRAMGIAGDAPSIVRRQGR